MRLFSAMLLMGTALSVPAAAQERDVVPIAEVIGAFKEELREVRDQTRTACTFKVERVDFTFLAETRSETTGGAEGTIEVFGVEVGGSAEQSEGRTATSTIEVSFQPRAGHGLEEVEGSAAAQALQGFGDLIRNTKEQIEAAAEADDSLEVRQIVVETDFKIERQAGGKLSIVVTGETSLERANSHHVVLTLGPASEGGC